MANGALLQWFFRPESTSATHQDLLAQLLFPRH
jgi:hypothetical protein